MLYFVPLLINGNILETKIRGHVDDTCLLQKFLAHKACAGSLGRRRENNIRFLRQLQEGFFHLLRIIIDQRKINEMKQIPIYGCHLLIRIAAGSDPFDFHSRMN